MTSNQVNKNLLRAIDEIEDYAFFFLDLNGNIQSWNSGAQKIKGYNSQEIIGKSFKCFYSKEDLEAQVPDHLLKEATQNGKALVEGWRVKKDGTTFWGSVLITVTHNDDGQPIGFGKLTRDLTHRKKMEELTEEYCQKLKEMLHMTSHRIRGPLTRCMGLMNLMEDEESLDENELKEVLGYLKSSAVELNVFTEELTVYMSKLEKKYRK